MPGAEQRRVHPEGFSLKGCDSSVGRMRHPARWTAVLALLIFLLSSGVSLHARGDSGKKPPPPPADATSGQKTDGTADDAADEATEDTASEAALTSPTIFEFRPIALFQSVPGAPSPQNRSQGDGSTFVEWRLRGNDTDLKGNVERSFLNPGQNNHGEVTFLRKIPLWDFRQLEIMGMYRYTDDPRLDPEVNSLQRGYARFSGPTFELNLGDYLTNYSRFSFNQNTKGLNLTKQFQTLRIMGTAGVFTDRWGSLFKGWESFADPRQPLVPLLDPITGAPLLDPITGAPILGPDPANPAKPYTRFVAGYRMEQSMGESSFIALNFVHGADIKRTLPLEATFPPVSNDILTFDTDLRGGKTFSFSGEFAFAQSAFDTRIQKEKKSSYATRLELSHRFPRLSWRVNFARFMPNFFSANARQVQDLQDLSARASLDLGVNTVLDFSFRRTRDNLPGRSVLVRDPVTDELLALTNQNRARDLNDNGVLDLDEIRNFIVDPAGVRMTTRVQTPEVRLSFLRLPPGRIMNIGLGFRERKFSTSNKGSFQIDAVTGESIPLFRDRVTRMPFLELNWNGQSTRVGLSYEYRQSRDSVRTVDTTFTNRFMGSYSGTYFIGNYILEALMRFETEPEAKSIECTDSDRQNIAGNTSACFLSAAADFSARDQTRSYRGMLNLEFPKYVVLELFYRELNAKLLTSYTQDTTDLLGNPVTVRQFGNGGFRRPTGRAAAIFKFANSDDVQLIASYERGVNTFLNPDPNAIGDDRSFRESVMQVEFIWRINRNR